MRIRKFNEPRYRVVQLDNEPLYKVQYWKIGWFSKKWQDYYDWHNTWGGSYATLCQYENKELACAKMKELQKEAHVQALKDSNKWNTVNCECEKTQ